MSPPWWSEGPPGQLTCSPIQTQRPVHMGAQREGTVVPCWIPALLGRLEWDHQPRVYLTPFPLILCSTRHPSEAQTAGPLVFYLQNKRALVRIAWTNMWNRSWSRYCMNVSCWLPFCVSFLKINMTEERCQEVKSCGMIAEKRKNVRLS